MRDRGKEGKREIGIKITMPHESLRMRGAMREGRGEGVGEVLSAAGQGFILEGAGGCVCEGAVLVCSVFLLRR